MKKSIYDQIGGFSFIRKMIAEFYNKVLDNDELALLFEKTDMERIIDHQTKFFAMLLGGPISFSDEEIEQVHRRLLITHDQFELTKDCLEETLEDFDLSDEHIIFILEVFEAKRELIVQMK